MSLLTNKDTLYISILKDIVRMHDTFQTDIGKIKPIINCFYLLEKCSTYKLQLMAVCTLETCLCSTNKHREEEGYKIINLVHFCPQLRINHSLETYF